VIISTQEGMDGVDGIVANENYLLPETADKWGELINSCVEDRGDVMNEMISRNFQIVSSKYQWESIVQKLEEQLMSLHCVI